MPHSIRSELFFLFCFVIFPFLIFPFLFGFCPFLTFIFFSFLPSPFVLPFLYFLIFTFKIFRFLFLQCSGRPFPFLFFQFLLFTFLRVVISKLLESEVSQPNSLSLYYIVLYCTILRYTLDYGTLHEITIKCTVTIFHTNAYYDML